MLIDEFIRLIPKAELNVHLEGCLTQELAKACAERNHLKLTLPEQYQFNNLQGFLQIYNTALQVLITEEDFFDLAMAYYTKAAQQNIRHAEISFDAQAHLARGIALQTIINGLTKAQQKAQQTLKISSLFILCFLRDLSEDAALKVFEQALQFKDHIVAIGLDSVEIDNPPEKFKNLFKQAQEQGFLTVAIAGETGPPEYIWQAIDILGVARIGHGVQCMQDPDLITRLSAKQIPIDVCPVSNVRLGLYTNLKQHPLKKMYEDGIFVTVNSDDPAYFNAYLNDNLIAANAALKLNKVIIYELTKNAFNASFLDYVHKEKLINELDMFYKKCMA